jgi:hypothetical protein
MSDANEPQFRFPLTSPDPLVQFAALVERGIAEMETKKAEKKAKDEVKSRLELVFGEPVDESEITFDFRAPTDEGS